MRHPERSRFSGGARDLARSRSGVKTTRSRQIRGFLCLTIQILAVENVLQRLGRVAPGNFHYLQSRVHRTGRFNSAVALIIATAKALLVALFFMHLKGAPEKLLKLVVISTVFFLFILLALSMADYGTRTWS